ncbi:hypothetical protein AOLI_G00020540 [Acnodon oligacanthus]
MVTLLLAHTHSQSLPQTQHQALLDAQRENQARFEALAQGQEADRRLLRSLLSGPSIPASTAATMSVSKMTPQDDPEAFVELFERAAGVWGWPIKDWAIRLLPLLTGEAQLAAQQLPAQSQLEYDELKRAVLQRVGRTPEQHRQRFRSLSLREFDRPFVLAQQLRDSCRRWLLSEERDPGEILDLVVLEQFITRLPEETAAWVQCHQPGSLDEATRQAEAHIAAYSGAGAPTQHLSVPVTAPRKRVALGPKPLPRSRAAPSPPLRLNPAATRALPSLPAPGPAAEPTRAEVKPRQVCWRCGEPGHFQDQCHHMEVGTLVRVTTRLPRSGGNVPHTGTQRGTYCKSSI